MWPQLTLRGKKAIDRSAWLLLLHCFSGSLSKWRLGSCRSQAATDPRGCVQSSTWGGKGEQDDRELNTAIKWHWLPARIQNRSLRANGCWEQLILSSSLSHPQALGAPLQGQQDTTPRGHRQFCRGNILSVQADRKAELALNLCCYKVWFFLQNNQKNKLS